MKASVRTILIIIILGAFNSACLSIFYFPLYQSLDLSGVPEGVQVTALANGEVLDETVTPGSLSLRKMTSISLLFQKEGFYDRSVILEPEPSNGMIWLSFLVSMPTMFIGLFIDLGSGAVHSYPDENLKIEMIPVSESIGSRPLWLTVRIENDYSGSVRIVIQ